MERWKALKVAEKTIEESESQEEDYHF